MVSSTGTVGLAAPQSPRWSSLRGKKVPEGLLHSVVPPQNLPTEARAGQLPHLRLSLGPTKSALVLLCCFGTWLAVHTAHIPTPSTQEVEEILQMLVRRSKHLLCEYKQKENLTLTEQEKENTLPCFSLGPQASANISIILGHLNAIRQWYSEATENIRAINIQLEKLCQVSTEASVSLPTDGYKRKVSILAVLHEFYSCMVKIHSTFKNRQKSAPFNPYKE